jgi:hypothetical protein
MEGDAADATNCGRMAFKAVLCIKLHPSELGIFSNNGQLAGKARYSNLPLFVDERTWLIARGRNVTAAGYPAAVRGRECGEKAFRPPWIYLYGSRTLGSVRILHT